MMRKAGFCFALSFAAACASAGASEFGVLVRFGLHDRDAKDWSGSVSIEGGRVTRLAPWHFAGKSRIVDATHWTARSRDPGGPKNARGRRIGQVGVFIYGEAGPEARLTVKTAQGAFSFKLRDAGVGRRVVALKRAAAVEPAAAGAVLSDSDREDDYPSACLAPDGSLWCVWQSYEKLQDQLYYAARKDGSWTKPRPIPGAKGDLYKSACAWVGGRLWVVWAQFEKGDWNLKAASFDRARWSAPQLLTTAKGADIEPALAARGDAGALAWQAFRGAHSDIWLMPIQAGRWGAARRVTAAPGNDWTPAVAIGPKGVVSIAWDTYRNGSYDVYLRQWSAGRFGPEIPVAASKLFEAYATVAADERGRVWIAYEEGTAGWGKDQGAVVPRPRPGTRLYQRRAVQVRVWSDGKLFAPARPVQASVPAAARRYHEKPRLAADGKGRIWLALRWPMMVKRYRRGRGHYFGFRAWESYLMCYEGDRWSPPVALPLSICRQDSYAVPCGLPGGGAAVAWHTDSRRMKDVRLPVKNRIVAGVVPLPTRPKPAALKPLTLPEPVKLGAKERADTRRARAYRVRVAGRELRLLRGDLHRHSEVSWDGSGDGSMVDVYRYTIDAGALDFFEMTDHNQRTGPDLEYVWWRTQKLADVYHNPPYFITLFGYERSLSFPNGHRNIINARRGFRTFPFTRNPSGGRGPAPDDTKQLYRYARRTGSITIPHTSATRMGTDWRDNDPEVEPVVEIYQGARTSYEYEGAPKSAEPGGRLARGSGYQPQGFVWRAWAKGLRLGVIASSDHGSTHISYASVFADAPTRQAVVDALRRRHTFAATDNLILDVRCGEHFMGDEFAQTAPPTLVIRAIGTAELSELAVIKDLKFVYVSDPKGTEARLNWTDQDFGPGRHLYYVRVQQTDGQIAWSSPLWITKR